MQLDKKDEIIIEYKFDKYIRINIFGIYKRFVIAYNKSLNLVYLNEISEGGNERGDLIVGDYDVIIVDRIIFTELEDYMDSDEMYDAIKLLTKIEKLAVSLCLLEGKKGDDVAKALKYKDRSSVNKMVRKAKRMIREKLKRRS